jgi:nucleoid-associated protein YgaU
VIAHGRIHVVKPGDNLWQIARAELIRARGTERPDDAEIAPYWRRVITANRATLRSGDPSLIFPGEVVAVPFPDD